MKGNNPPQVSFGISREDIEKLTDHIKENVLEEIKKDPEAFLGSSPDSGEKLYTIKEVGKKLSRSDVTIRNWCHDGKLKHMKFGERNMMISQDQLNEFISNSKSENHE